MYISYNHINFFVNLTEEQNVCEFGKLGITGGNKTPGHFLSALLIEMVLLKLISL